MPLNPPKNIEAERAVLGACLMDENAIYLARAIVAKPELFFGDNHQAIYKAMLEIADKGRRIDSVVVMTQLMQDGALELAGGATYLADLTAAIPTSANVEYYSEAVANSALARELMLKFSTLAKQAAKARDAREYAAESLNTLEAVIREVGGNSSAAPTDERISDALDHWLNRLQGDSPMGMMTGIWEIDQKLHYGLSDEIIVIAARPSVGKTALMLTIAEHVARRYGPVYIGSAESSAEKLFQRLNAIVCPHEKFILACRDGRKARAQLMQQYLPSLRRRKILVNDHARYIEDMTTTVRAHCLRDPNITMVFLDYLQRFDTRKKTRGETESVNHIMRQIALLRDRIKRPVVVLSQLSRGEYKDEWGPGLNHLKQSGNIEQDADIVLLLWKKEAADHEESPWTAEVQARIAKQRDGPTGRLGKGLQLIRPQTLFISPEHGRDLGDEQMEFSTDDEDEVPF